MELFTLNLLNQFIIPLSFLSGVLIGDNVALGFSFLASQKIIPFFQSIIPALFGMVSTDYLFFLFGKTHPFRKFKKSKTYKRLFSRIEKAITSLTNHKPLTVMFYTKFTVGTKFLVYVNLSNKKISHGKFLLYTFISSTTWVIFTSIIGWYAGKGFSWFVTIFNNLHFAAIAGTIMFIVVIQVHNRIHSKILKKHDPKIKGFLK